MQKIDRQILARELRAEIALLQKLKQGEIVDGLQLNQEGITLEWIESQIRFNRRLLDALEGE